VERGWDASRHLRALLEHRRQQGLPSTHEWLAQETGIRQGQISSYATENTASRRNLGRKNAEKIARALGVTLAELGLPTRVPLPNGTSLEWLGLAPLLVQLTERVEVLPPELRAWAEAAADELEASGRYAIEAAELAKSRLARVGSESRPPAVQ
jgi:transcriptional regulator with XRE-family HTH domain